MSNVNYDPVKAHEYYMKHKKSSTTRSTKGMTDTQKEQWSFAKAQISDNYKATRTAITDQSKAERTQLSDAAKVKIKAIQNRLKGLSSDQKAALKSQIAGIREKLKTDKSALTDKTSLQREGAKAQKENDLNTAYNTIKGKK